MFNRDSFTASFPKTLTRLERAEKLSKDVLMPLSRDLLFMLHTDDKNQGDIGYINRTIAVLSPANKKVFVLFMREFTGFILNDDATMFMKKSKKHYDVVKAGALAWLADPLNNYFSWVGRQKIESTPVVFDKAFIVASTRKMLDKAAKNGMSHVDVLAAMFEGGLVIEDLLAVVDKLGYEFGEAQA
jgi:hypothetical protein